MPRGTVKVSDARDGVQVIITPERNLRLIRTLVAVSVVLVVLSVAVGVFSLAFLGLAPAGWAVWEAYNQESGPDRATCGVGPNGGAGDWVRPPIRDDTQSNALRGTRRPRNRVQRRSQGGAVRGRATPEGGDSAPGGRDGAPTTDARPRRHLNGSSWKIMVAASFLKAHRRGPIEREEKRCRNPSRVTRRPVPVLTLASPISRPDRRPRVEPIPSWCPGSARSMASSTRCHRLRASA